MTIFVFKLDDYCKINLQYMQESSWDWENRKDWKNLTECFLLQCKTVRWKSIHKKNEESSLSMNLNEYEQKAKKNIIYDYEEILN